MQFVFAVLAKKKKKKKGKHSHKHYRAGRQDPRTLRGFGAKHVPTPSERDPEENGLCFTYCNSGQPAQRGWWPMLMGCPRTPKRKTHTRPRARRWPSQPAKSHVPQAATAPRKLPSYFGGGAAPQMLKSVMLLLGQTYDSSSSIPPPPPIVVEPLSSSTSLTLS